MTAATITARQSFTVPIAPDIYVGTAKASSPSPFAMWRNSLAARPCCKASTLMFTRGSSLRSSARAAAARVRLLRLLAGLDKPTSGELVHGSWTHDHKRTRIMFQEPRLLPWARVARNVEVGLTGIEKGDAARKKGLEILAEVGLDDRGGEWPSVLSGGQRQRVALARALVGHPSILALDEPLGALDALTRIEMQQLLERIWLAKKFTAVLVTHDVTEAVALADRVVVIDSGQHRARSGDIPVERPRRHASPELAFFERQILDQFIIDKVLSPPLWGRNIHSSRG